MKFKVLKVHSSLIDPITWITTTFANYTIVGALIDNVVNNKSLSQLG
jgi:hypothetical protein